MTRFKFKNYAVWHAILRFRHDDLLRRAVCSGEGMFAAFPPIVAVLPHWGEEYRRIAGLTPTLCDPDFTGLSICAQWTSLALIYFSDRRAESELSEVLIQTS
ncbi:MAG: hypothetical protein ABI791_15130 [Acidobacteriota bacterium]